MVELRLQIVGCDDETEAQVRDRFVADGVDVQVTHDLADAARAFPGGDPDVVMLDADHSARDVLRCLEVLKSSNPELPIILCAGTAEMTLIVEAMRSGAYDFVSKPLDLTRLGIVIKNASQTHRLLQRVNQLQDRHAAAGSQNGLIGQSQSMRRLHDVIENVSNTDVTVLVTGESGSGKELIARAIHDLSGRRNASFVAVNCGSIPGDLLESELFGHEAGAIPGGASRYIGCCEQAHGGTLFLDEVCEIDPSLQSKLLRFIQSGTVQRVGSTEHIQIDARIIASTNRDPRREVAEGRLRDDLFYRLNVVPVEAPPLRERPGDVALLAHHFLTRFAAKYGKYFYDFAPEVLPYLDRYGWPGNVRELENMIERVVVLNTAAQVSVSMLPRIVLEADGRAPDDVIERGPEEILPFTEIEKREIARAIRICGGNVSRAAERLGLGQATLYRKIKKYDIRLRRRAREEARS